MFVILLGGTLIFSAGLLAAASYSEGALLAVRTAAQVMGWLFVCAVLLARALRASRASAGELGATVVTLFSGVALLYVSYFQWGEIQTAAPAPYAVAAEPLPLPGWKSDYKFIDYPFPVMARTSVQEVVARPPAQVPVAKDPIPAAKDPCASLNEVESLQCRRCADKSGLRLVVCHETARLEYCADRPGDEATCPSVIPYSPPG
jgi:hypothetical protein